MHGFKKLGMYAVTLHGVVRSNFLSRNRSPLLEVLLLLCQLLCPCAFLRKNLILLGKCGIAD